MCWGKRRFFVVTLLAGTLSTAHAAPPAEPFLVAPPGVRFGPEGRAWLELTTTLDLASAPAPQGWRV